MIETERYCFEGLTLPIVYEPAPGSRLHSHSDVLEWLHRREDELVAELHRSGALLLRDFSIEGPGNFREIAEVFAPRLKSYAGGDSPRTMIADKVYTSTSYPSSLPMSLHNEMSYSRDYPAVVAFHCEVPPAADGETPLADCRRVLSALSPRVVNRFKRKRVRYVQNLHTGAGLGRSWRETFETDDREQVEKILDARGAEFFWKSDGSLRVEEVTDPIIAHPRSGEEAFFCQAHQWHPSCLDSRTREALLRIVKEEDLYHSCTFGDGSPIGEEDLTEIRRALDAAAVEFPWRKRDVLLVDNILVAHGRKPFSGARRILVAMG
jgi:alpha-ketoglutarate-dependent taurine dioxygenase